MKPVSIDQACEAHRICVLVPTYNNAGTLPKLLEELGAMTRHVVVVNDGSTDGTEAILSGFPWVQHTGYAENRGKGWALRKGFEFARSLGYDHAITIDSDGQHYPHDLVRFIEAFEATGEAIYVGQRNMEQANVPGKSSFGNKFSNFWFRLFTGIKLQDTQSGYRMYPLRPLSRIRFVTRKYEFEVEVMVRAAWRGVKVLPVPVSVYYPPPGERITHFRPFRDFSRISVLNTVLCLIAIFWYWPVRLLGKIVPKAWKDQLHNGLVDPAESNGTKVMSVALGLFMGIVPIWGFQLVTAIFLAFMLKLNKPLVVLFAHISIPPMIPLVIYGSYKMGAIWLPASSRATDLHLKMSLHDISLNLRQYILGSFTLAIVAAVSGALLTYILIKIFGGGSTSESR